MAWQIDGSLYPDMPPPTRLSTLADHVDYLARLCAAWDFGLLPDKDTVEEIRRPAWRLAVETCNLLSSPTYHLLRHWHRLPTLSYLGSIPARVLNDPYLHNI
jgi:hypothetical protein